MSRCHACKTGPLVSGHRALKPPGRYAQPTEQATTAAGVAVAAARTVAETTAAGSCGHSFGMRSLQSEAEERHVRTSCSEAAMHMPSQHACTFPAYIGVFCCSCMHQSTSCHCCMHVPCACALTCTAHAYSLQCIGEHMQSPHVAAMMAAPATTAAGKAGAADAGV